MVNTFLTYADFKRSAKSLDNARLGKQRVEAYQILCLIQDLALLQTVFDIPMPINPYKYSIWIKQIALAYKKYNYYFFYRQGNIYKVPRIKPIRLRPNQKAYFNDDATITVSTRKRALIAGKGKSEIQTIAKIYSTFGVLMPGDRCVTLGFVYHPAVVMWLGYADALKEYINAHIDEWVNRGYNNNMVRYDLTSYLRPIWTFDPRIHINHRASLLFKEKSRKEKPHYIKQEDFVNAGPFIDYIWPFKNNRYCIIEKDGHYCITFNNNQ